MNPTKFIDAHNCNWRGLKSILALFLTLFLFLCFGQAFGNNWYSEYWQQASCKVWECGRFRLDTFLNLKTGNHLKNIRFIQISPQLSYKVCDDFILGLNYSYIHARSIVALSPWHWQHRLELEANPTFHLWDKNRLETRNRLEIRKVQDNPKIQYRLRQLTKLVFPIENCGHLKAYSLYNELFYNLSTHLFTQDRVCPLSLTFALTEKVDLEVFFLVRFFLKDDIWRRSAVLGTEISF